MPATHNFSDVFISYSRRDRAFTERLYNALIQHPSIDDIWIDWEDIPESADWWQEIEAGIDGANVFLFIITPDSVRSEYCYNEIDHAEKSQKRIIPLVYREVKDPQDEDYFHPAIRRHNWLFLREEDNFDEKLHDLITVLFTDLEHVNKHTRYLVRSQEWNLRGRDPSYLLSGVEIDISERWLEEAERDQKTPILTDLHKEYIHTSRAVDEADKAETARREQVIRRSQRASAVLAILFIVAVVAGAVSAYQVTQSQQQLQQANIQREQAERVRVTVAAESSNFQMIGQALLNRIDENDALAYAFEAVSNAQPPADILPIFYDIAAASRNIQTISGTATAVQSVDFSEDGEILAAVECIRRDAADLACADYQINLRDAADGHLLTTLPDEADPIQVAFSSSAPVLAAGYANGMLIFWDSSGDDQLAQIQAHESGIISLAYNADGTQLVTTSFDNTIRLWDTAGYTEITPDVAPFSYPAESYSAAISPDNSTLASAHTDGVINLWDIASGQRVSSLNGHQSWVSTVAFSPDGRQLASSSFDGVVKVWDLETGTAANFIGHDDWVSRVAFSSDGRQLASASFDNTIILWDVEQTSAITTLYGHDNWVSDVAFNDDDMLLASASYDGTSKLWDVTSGVEFVSFTAHQADASAVMFSPDNTLLASGGFDDTVHLWHAASQALITSLNGHRDSVTGLAFSPDGQRLASASLDNTITVWTVATDDVQTLMGHDSSVNAIDFSPKDDRLVSGGQDKTVRLWNATTGAVRTLQAHDSGVTAVTYNASGTVIASGSQDGMLILWSDAGTRLSSRQIHGSDINALAFNPAGDKLVSGAQDGTVILWSLTDDNTLTEFMRLRAGATTGITSIAYNPDGETIAAASQDGQLTLWSAITGDELYSMATSRGAIYDINFSSDGRLLSSAHADGSLTLWNLGSPAMMRQWVQSNRYVREFTCRERQQFSLAVQCNDDGTAPTRTPLPTMTPVIAITGTPFWDAAAMQIDSPSITPALLTPFWLPPSPTPTATPTATATATITPTVTLAATATSSRTERPTMTPTETTASSSD